MHIANSMLYTNSLSYMYIIRVYMHIAINVTISSHKHTQINTSGTWAEVDTSECEMSMKQVWIEFFKNLKFCKINLA